MPILPLLRRALPAAAMLALPACVRSSSPPPRPEVARPTPAPIRPAPPAADNWEDRPVTPGTWRYERDARGSRALFGTVGADARLVLRCDIAERRIYLSRAGTQASPLTVRTTSQARSLAVQPTGGTPPYVAVALERDDRLLDALAFSRGRVAVEQAGVPALVLPTHAEIGRVIEDCRG